jgi:methylmalonyl-CoA epimerase
MPHVMRIKRIHHLTVAVRDVDRAGATFEALFGAGVARERAIPSFGVRTRDVPLGDDVLELASPLAPDSPVMRFIERKGEGFYNLALEVEDLDGALTELADRGIKVSEPVEAAPGARSAFITMGATHGLSIQLVELVDTLDEVSAEPENVATPGTEEQAASSEPLDLTPDEWSDTD